MAKYFVSVMSDSEPEQQDSNIGETVQRNQFNIEDFSADDEVFCYISLLCKSFSASISHIHGQITFPS